MATLVASSEAEDPLAALRPAAVKVMSPGGLGISAALKAAPCRIALNLSGTVFITTRDTLMRDERTYFAAMLRMQPPMPTQPMCQTVSSSL